MDTPGIGQAESWARGAIAVAEPERSFYLAEVCPDPELRRAISELARACDTHPDLADSIGLVADSTKTTAVSPVPGFELQPGITLGRYLLEAPLGRGGMGEVYLARDTTLDRRVAIKALVRTGGEPELRALNREAHAVAQLNHPGIAAVYDVLSHEGRAFIVMEFVPGRTLAHYAKSTTLTPEQIADIAQQIATALDHAHRAGIVHCDLKPSNIKITDDGAVKVLDFGLAKVSRGGHAGHEFTYEGIAGTPGYMSPEQLVGKRPDARTDLFSLGIILFELSAGTRPFPGSDAVAQALAVLTQPNPDLPYHVRDPLRSVIQRCLVKEPQRRFQSAREILDVLKTAGASHVTDIEPVVTSRWRSPIAIAASATVLLAVLVAGLNWRQTPPPSVRQGVLAVLPFTPDSPELASIASGLGDLVASDLGRVPGVVMIPRAATLKYAATPDSYAKLRGNLGADLAITAGVTRNGSDISADVTLVDVQSGATVWARRFQGTTSTLAELQHQISGSALTQLGHAPAAAKPPAQAIDVQALEDYTQGRLFLDRPDDPGNVDRALTLFESAAARDRHFALAPAAIGEASWMKYTLTRDRQWTEKARNAALDALRLDPEQAMVRYTLALVYRGTGRTDDAIDELKRAIQLQPSNDEFHRELGRTYTSLNRTDDAVAELSLARALRPGFWDTYRALGLAYYRAGRWDDAIGAFKRAAELQPDSNSGFQMLGAAYQQKGDLDNALASYAKANTVKPSPTAWSNIGVIRHQRGQFAEAVAAYQQAIALQPNEPTTHRNLGDAYMRVPDRAKARASYQQAIALIEGELKVNPRSAPRLALEAVCRAKLGQIADARRLAESAVQLSPKSGESQYQRAVVETFAGNLDEAERALTSAIESGYSRDVAQSDEDLTNLRKRPAVQELLRRR